MATGLNSLPLPPKGQTGMTLDQFQHLPPPPKGQTGVTLDQIQSKQPAQVSQSPNLGQLTADQYSQAGQKVSDSVSRGAQDFQQGNIGQGLLDAGLGTAAGVSQGITAPLTATLQKVFGGLPQGKNSTPNVVDIPGKISAWAQQHPDAARNLTDAFTVGTTALGDVGGAANPLNTDVGATFSAGNKAIGSATADIVSSAKTTLANQGTDKSLKMATDALNPDLTGKAKTAAYKQVATQGRQVKPAGIFTDQKLAPSTRATNTAVRLSNNVQLSDGTKVSGVKFGKDPVQNLSTIGKALDDTETRLQADSGMKAPLDKPTLISNLEALKEEKPQDFIGDNGKIYDNVVSYAQKVATEAEDTIGGGREARIKFDNEAQRKFPTAYKNGAVDTTTPAGSAIKTVRDAFNKHLYDTSPTGSDMQSLIGREADLLNANDISSAKAAAGHGSNWVKQFIKQHPIAAHILGYTAVGEAARHILP